MQIPKLAKITIITRFFRFTIISSENAKIRQKKFSTRGVQNRALKEDRLNRRKKTIPKNLNI
jgi:hypothetical protein